MHLYTLSDTYTVALNVTDTKGNWNTTSRIINVTEQTLWHDIAIVNVVRLPGSYYDDNYVYPNWYGTPPSRSWEPFRVNVTVSNLGNYVETFNVNVYYENATYAGNMGTQTVNNLAQG